MNIVLERNFVPHFIGFLDLQERIALRQLCKLGRQNVLREEGTEARGISLNPLEDFSPRGMDHSFCHFCKYLFRDIRAHFASFPHHANITGPPTFVSWKDCDNNPQIIIAEEELQKTLYECSSAELTTFYGKLTLGEITRRGRSFGLDIEGGEWRRLVRKIELNFRQIHIICGRLYVKIKFSRSGSSKLAAVISISVGPRACLPF
jgi:hypothetical protein